ncbi:MAG: hypothetical protein DSY80_11235 [Desulfocapsa sp.]|nr:MAG: hypothetical protein DSY80_11235 [Desulfocapsa sp.]
MSDHPFHFLSQLYSYPEQDSLQQNAATLNLLASDLGMGQIHPDEISGYSLLEMQAEYVRLFINSRDGVFAPPYASIYVNDAGILRQQGYDEALAYYAEAGVEAATTTESPDHIAHELGFVALLLDREQDELLDRFLNKHLLLWYPGFLQRLQQAEPCSFYSVLGQITDLCLRKIQKEVIHE